MQQGELEHCWLPLGLCAVCSGDEQMLEKSFISPLVSFFPPPGHPVSLETTLPCAELGYQCANPCTVVALGSSSSVLAGTTANPILSWLLKAML